MTVLGASIAGADDAWLGSAAGKQATLEPKRFLLVVVVTGGSQRHNDDEPNAILSSGRSIGAGIARPCSGAAVLAIVRAGLRYCVCACSWIAFHLKKVCISFPRKEASKASDVGNQRERGVRSPSGFSSRANCAVLK